MTTPIVCVSCGFPIGFIISLIEGNNKGGNIDFVKIEKKIGTKIKTCCRMKILTYIDTY